MRETRVRDLMLPVDRYTAVSDAATLEEVFGALEGALAGMRNPDSEEARDLAVLVLDGEGRALGRLTVWDVLQGLEPQARRRVDSLAMVDGYDAWDRPLDRIASKAREVRARDLVTALHHREFIDEGAGLNEALRRLVDDRYLSLIVTRSGEAVGILRVVDVFRHVCGALRAENERSEG